jgi:enamine deaminase RidA (YjgF/YER057c/UK114 family)
MNTDDSDFSRRGLVSVAAVAAIAVAASEADAAEAGRVQYVRPATMFRPGTFSHAVEITGPHKLIYLAGQQGKPLNGALPKDFTGQAQGAFENMKLALAAVGATMDHVVKTTTYVTDLKAATPLFGPVRSKFFKPENPPASTLLQVSALTNDALIEIEAVAAVPM